MNQGRLRTLGALILVAACASFLAATAEAQKLAVGKLAGVVRDSEGIPQLGASVQVVAEAARVTASRQFLTNTQGIFRGEKLSPGLYTIRVTLAGFLPTLDQHVRISSNLTTVVRIEMESMFASLDQLRREPSSIAPESDDWKWVLRSASAMRPVLQWQDDPDGASHVADQHAAEPRMQLQFTDGALRPGSVSNLVAAPSTAFAYDQRIGRVSRLLLAGQMSYEGAAPSAGIATVWLPTGSLETGLHTALVMRETKIGPDGPSFRGMRFDQGGAMMLGDRLLLHYGGEYVLVGLGSATSAIRPRLRLDARFSGDWQGTLVFSSQPASSNPLDTSEGELGASLAAALGELDAFPALVWRDGHPVLQGGWHEEVSAQRKLGSRGSVQVAAFHDDNRNLAVFGRGRDLPAADFFQDYFSNAFAYDGGSSSSWGGRVAFREKLDGDVELTAVYSYGGALAPDDVISGPLRDSLRTVGRHSMGAGVSGKVPRLGTKVDVGYKWISGVAVSRVDPYGESLYQLDPYLHLAVRQPLPKFAPGRWEAIADCENLLAQGYVPTDAHGGHLVLVPAFRTFRGGVSVQF